MLNFNPATYWFQWWRDQFEGEDGAGAAKEPFIPIRLALGAQLAGLKSYREMIKAVQDGKARDQMTDSWKEMWQKTWDALASQQPAMLGAHLGTLDTFIKKVEEEIDRFEKYGERSK